MNQNFNLVYDNWNPCNENPEPNGSKLYERKGIFSDASNLVKHYIDDSTKLDKYKFVKCSIDEVTERPNEKFYYFINYRLNIEDFLTENQKPFDDKILDYIKNKSNFLVVFLTEHECDNENGFKILNDYIISNQFDGSKFYMINNNAKLQDYKIKYNSTINVHSIQFIPHSSTKVLVKVGGIDFIPNKNGKFSMLFNKTTRPHRVALLCLLKTEGLLDEMNWSFVPSYNRFVSEHFIGNLFDEEDVTNNKNSIDYLYDLGIKVSDYEIDKNWFIKYNEPNLEGFPPWMTIPEFSETYKYSYLNIITESQFDNSNNVIHISEKSFRPFFYYQFPMILATHGHIKKMKERYDLDFFDDIIDHSYDNELDEKTRLFSFFNEIKRLHNNKEQLIDFYKNNQERFENNKQKIISLLEIVEQDYDFFNNLI
jgi:hypothetical protein